MTELTIRAAQADMRNAYLDGAPGVLVSGLVWLTASVVAALGSEKASVLALLFGGAAIFLTPSFTLGFEARQHTKRPPVFEGGGVYSAFFAGPSISVSGANWWSALSIMPQIAGSEKNGSGIDSQNKLDLTIHEKLEARFLLSFDF